MKKKLLITVLTITILLIITGCGNNNEQSNEDSITSTVVDEGSNEQFNEDSITSTVADEGSNEDSDEGTSSEDADETSETNKNTNPYAGKEYVGEISNTVITIEEINDEGNPIAITIDGTSVQLNDYGDFPWEGTSGLLFIDETDDDGLITTLGCKYVFGEEFKLKTDE